MELTRSDVCILLLDGLPFCYTGLGFEQLFLHSYFDDANIYDVRVVVWRIYSAIMVAGVPNNKV